MALLFKPVESDCESFDFTVSDFSPIIRNLNLTVNSPDGDPLDTISNIAQQGIFCVDISKKSLLKVLDKVGELGGLRFIPGVKDNKLVFYATPYNTPDGDEVVLKSKDPEKDDVVLFSCCPQPGGGRFVNDTELAKIIFPEDEEGVQPVA